MTLAPSPPFWRLTYFKVQWRSPVAWRALLLSSEDHLRGLRETNEANHEGERGRCADPNQWHKCVMFKKLNNTSDIFSPLLDVIVFDIWVLYQTGWKFLSVVSPFFQTKLNWLPSVLAALYNIRQLMKLLENLDFLVIWKPMQRRNFIPMGNGGRSFWNMHGGWNEGRSGGVETRLTPNLSCERQMVGMAGTLAPVSIKSGGSLPPPHLPQLVLNGCCGEKGW